MRQFKLLFLLGLLVWPTMAAPRASPPRCPVEAVYTPRFGSEFGSLLVRLRPGCAPNGLARIRLGNYGGPGSRATGPTETLSRSRPALVWQAQPHYRSVLWESESGVQYSVTIRRR